MKRNTQPLDVEDLSFERVTIVMDSAKPINPEAKLVAVKGSTATLPAPRKVASGPRR